MEEEQVNQFETDLIKNDNNSKLLKKFIKALFITLIVAACIAMIFFMAQIKNLFTTSINEPVNKKSSISNKQNGVELKIKNKEIDSIDIVNPKDEILLMKKKSQKL
ncbi:hypothetical protein LBMAG33_5790 [Candidatus Levyibacteriota bacterium]|nr:hypothetical protein LBMAG33_5790 [Candidatus Levybacteria bacterium]